MTQRIGIYPGTFDPITHGHMDIITRALNVVDRLIIAVAKDSTKQPIFDLNLRAKLVGEVIPALGADAKRVQVETFSGLLADFARAHRATLLIRGLRAVSDFEYEFQMANINSKLAPELETVFLAASESTHFISSRFVKEIARLGGDISGFVPPEVAVRLRRHFSESD